MLQFSMMCNIISDSCIDWTCQVPGLYWLRRRMKPSTICKSNCMQVTCTETTLCCVMECFQEHCRRSLQDCQPTEDGQTLAGRGKISFSKIVCKSTYLQHRVGALSQALLAIDTGRKHQIRSHLAHVDIQLFETDFTRAWTLSILMHLFHLEIGLHRHRLIFQDLAGEKREVFSELPQDLQLPSSIMPFQLN